MEDLNIICFLWNGDRWNVEAERGFEYVNVLYHSVQRNLSLPHRFICMTNFDAENFDEGIELLPLNAPSWKGCLPKLCMFDPSLGLTGRVFSLDIDVIITGSLDEMASCQSDMIVRASFADPRSLDGDIVGFKITPKIAEKVWVPLKKNPAKAEAFTGGRERYWYRLVFSNKIDTYQKLYPNQLASYKKHLRFKQYLPECIRIVSCHGRPRPHELSEKWAITNWRI